MIMNHQATQMINPVHVVLVKPIYPRNIGMCARAIANFGLQSLIIVAPQTKIGHIAKQGAAHAQRILREARIYESMDQFYRSEGEGVRIALSGKDARLKKSDWIEETLAKITADPSHPIQSSQFPIYLFFGAEDDGLAADEMALCHYICKIPTYSEVTSLNLSHAVLLTSYLVRRELEKLASVKASINSDSLKTSQAADVAIPAEKVEADESAWQANVLQPAYFPHESIRQWLELLGFDLSAPRVNIEKTLKRILLAQAPTREELHTLNSLLHQTIRKLEPRDR